MISFKMDGRKVQAEENATILEVAKAQGIDIPTFCYHQALGPYGACRVCLVEVNYQGRSKLVTSCTYPVWEGIEVKTNSEKVTKARRFIVELLLGRCPTVKPLQELARKLGLEGSRFKTSQKNEECILCGLCLRVCKDVIGTGAISFVNRGLERKVETPFQIESRDCIGCGACEFVCPTGAIKIEDIKKLRKLHTCHLDLELVECKDCQRPFVPLKDLEYIKKKIDLPQEIFSLCPVCRRKNLKEQLGALKRQETVK